jgi:hypothetical protein
LTIKSIAIAQEVSACIVPKVISHGDSYLVVDDFTGDGSEVCPDDDGFMCGCFIAQVSNDCAHIRAVREYLSPTTVSQERPMMTQAEADVIMSQVAKLDHAQALNEGSAEDQIERIRLWLEMESKKLDRQRSYYVAALETWMHLNELSTKQLVNGTLKVRGQQPEIKINDEGAVLHDERFCRVVPEKRVVDKVALRKYVVSTGEEIDGTEVVLHPPKFSYKLDPGVEV